MKVRDTQILSTCMGPKKQQKNVRQKTTKTKNTILNLDIRFIAQCVFIGLHTRALHGRLAALLDIRELVHVARFDVVELADEDHVGHTVSTMKSAAHGAAPNR